MEHIRKAAERYKDMGMPPTPVEYRGKNPVKKGWTNVTVSAVDIINDFPENTQSNIGIVLGAASGGVVDIDIDDTLALRLADDFLPETGMVFGRDSNPKSHRIYRVSVGGTRIWLRRKLG